MTINLEFTSHKNTCLLRAPAVGVNFQWKYCLREHGVQIESEILDRQTCDRGEQRAASRQPMGGFCLSFKIKKENISL